MFYLVVYWQGTTVYTITLKRWKYNRCIAPDYTVTANLKLYSLGGLLDNYEI